MRSVAIRERVRYHSLDPESAKERNARRARLERERYKKLTPEELEAKNRKRRERAAAVVPRRRVELPRRKKRKSRMVLRKTLSRKPSLLPRHLLLLSKPQKPSPRTRVSSVSEYVWWRQGVCRFESCRHCRVSQGWTMGSRVHFLFSYSKKLEPCQGDYSVCYCCV